VSVDVETRPQTAAPSPTLDATPNNPRAGAATSRLNGAIVFALAALTIGAVGLLYVVQTSHVAKLGYEASRLQREREARALENDQLAYEVARYQSLPLVERVAVEQLGMTEMSAYRFLAVARPVQAELATPTPLAETRPSLMRRVWNRILGQGDVVHPDAGDGR
jgi:cell division protein FtsL